jgi:DNA mismatch repair protein MutL
VIPSIDFNTEPSLDFNSPADGQVVKNPFDIERSSFNPFNVEPKIGAQQRKINLENWEKLYDIKKEKDSGTDGSDFNSLIIQSEDVIADKLIKEKVFQWHNKYIVTNIVSGLVVINQQRAHERILYEQYLERLKNHNKASQQELFPQNVTFSPSDSELIEDLIKEIEIIGFTLNKLSKNTFVINGFPEGWENTDAQESLDKLLESYKQNLIELNLDKRINLARSMAVNMAVKSGKTLKSEEMISIMDQLFACQAPEVTPDGLRTYMILGVNEIDERFEN